MEKVTFTAEIDYTVDTRRGRHEITTRKTKAVHASSREKLGAAVERALKTLRDRGAAYSITVRWPARATEGEEV